MSERAEPLNSPPLIMVYEAINESLREIYLGTTELPYEAVAAGFRRSLPAAAAHWEPGNRVKVNLVEIIFRPDDARDFIRHYASSLEAAGWKALREDG